MKKLVAITSLVCVLLFTSVFATACSCNKKSKTVSVTGVALNKTQLSLEVGEDEVLIATVSPSDATDKTLIWSSSNTSVATVSENGKVTAVKKGSAVITVKTVDGNKTATCEVNVTSASSTIAVTGVTLNKTQLALTVGGQQTLVATVLPENATNKSVIWYSSNDDIATVENGKVVAKEVGTVAITVETVDGEKTAVCTVTVHESQASVAVTSVTLDKTQVLLAIDDEITLMAAVSPSNASNKSIIWSSSDNDVATVSSTGKVIAKQVGTCTITVKTVDGNKTATCEVTVTDEDIAVTSIAFDKESMQIEKNRIAQLSVKITPSNATNQSVTYSSSATDIVDISTSGVINAKAIGKATITVVSAENANIKDTIEIEVVKVSVSSVTLSETSVVIPTNSAGVTLIATVNPADAENKAVTWKSSNEDVATVVNGVVTPVSEGAATITVTTAEGNKTATCEVIVSNAKATAVSVTPQISNITVGSKAYLQASPNGLYDSIEWISNSSSVTIDNNGVVTAKAVEQAVIITAKVKVGEGQYIYGECTVNVINNAATGPEIPLN